MGPEDEKRLKKKAKALALETIQLVEKILKDDPKAEKFIKDFNNDKAYEKKFKKAAEGLDQRKLTNSKIFQDLMKDPDLKEAVKPVLAIATAAFQAQQAQRQQSMPDLQQMS